MIKSEAITLQPGDLVTVRRSGKTYRVDEVCPNDEQFRAMQLRNGKQYGPIRYLAFAAVDRLSRRDVLTPVLSPADDRHPASQALTAILQPTTIRTTADKLVSALTPDAWKPVPAPQPARREHTPRNDGDEGDRLARKVVRYAERWQRKFPCPPSTDQPELHAVWLAVEQLLAHDEGRAPVIQGDQSPATRAGKVRHAQAQVPAPLEDHGDRLTTTADALTERQADYATAALQRRGYHVERLQDQDGRWGITIWI